MPMKKASPILYKYTTIRKTGLKIKNCTNVSGSAIMKDSEKKIKESV